MTRIWILIAIIIAMTETMVESDFIVHDPEPAVVVEFGQIWVMELKP